MGGRSSKPVRKILQEPEQGSVDQTNEEEQDEVQTAQDTLNIAESELYYPEAVPPINDLPTIQEENEEEETLSIEDDMKSKPGKSAKPDSDVIIPVQIGASLQKTLTRKPSEARNERLNERFDYETESSVGEATMTLSMTSRQNSTLTEQYLQLMNKTLEKKRDLALLTQREMILLERESFEYRKLTSKSHSALSSTSRGQVRRTLSVGKSDDGADRKRQKKDITNTTANEAAEMHKQHRAASFKAITEDLTAGFKSETIKVKAILAWICKQSIGRIDFGQKRFDPDTPNGYMQLMQEGRGTYPGLFALLCRAAGIKCVIINGVSKGAGYELGSEITENLQNTWNAVFVDDGWRLVHPLWVCKSVAGRRPGGWKTIESQGSSRNDVSSAYNGVVTFSYNDYFIFTKPEEFIYRHYPDEPKWQLLHQPISLTTFLSKSYCRPSFFMSEFTLISQDTCVIESDTGEPVFIVIGFPESIASDVIFGYELSLKLADPDDNEEEEQNQHDTTNYGQFVFLSKTKDRVSFEVRFSTTGVYKLRLFGGLFTEYRNNPPWIMDVKLLCNSVVPKIDPLPFDPGLVGWGPSPITESLGMFVPSHENSTIDLTNESVTVIHFILKHKQEFDISLRHFKIRPGVLEDYVKYEILDVRDIIELRISIMCPKSGEYALRIDTCVDQDWENACNYLVRTDKKQIRETYYQRQARKLLDDAMMTCEIDPLTHALKVCEESVIPLDDPDTMAAERRLEYLHCKQELKTALLVKRIDKAERALYRVQQANFDLLFEKEIKRVKHHLKGILSLDKEGWTSRIPEIDRMTLMELSQLRQPKQPVRYVIMAMYMLLGVSQEQMTDWSQIKVLLRNKDSTLVEMARLENYLDMDSVEITSPDEPIIERVEEVLQTYSEEDIRRIDNTAAAYYIWVRTTHAKLKERMKTRTSDSAKFTSPGRYSALPKVQDSKSKSVVGIRRHYSFTTRMPESNSTYVTRQRSFNSKLGEPVKPTDGQSLLSVELSAIKPTGIENNTRGHGTADKHSTLNDKSNPRVTPGSVYKQQSSDTKAVRQNGLLSGQWTDERDLTMFSYRSTAYNKVYGRNSGTATRTPAPDDGPGRPVVRNINSTDENRSTGIIGQEDRTSQPKQSSSQKITPGLVETPSKKTGRPNSVLSKPAKLTSPSRNQSAGDTNTNRNSDVNAQFPSDRHHTAVSIKGANKPPSQGTQSGTTKRIVVAETRPPSLNEKTKQSSTGVKNTPENGRLKTAVTKRASKPTEQVDVEQKTEPENINNTQNQGSSHSMTKASDTNQTFIKKT